MNKIAIAKTARISRSQFSLINNQAQQKTKQNSKFVSAADLVERMKPSQPVTCIRPHVIDTAARRFVNSFPGKVMYAVKTNPDALVLRTIHAAGVNDFDVASLEEIKTVAKECKGAKMHYMHPVKSRESIMFAYNKFGIR
ncbi:MAG: hypothetical protein WCL30_03990, partial [Pseudomonadota bacterium]